MNLCPHMSRLLHAVKSLALFSFGFAVVVPGFLVYVLLSVLFYIYRLFVLHVLTKTYFCPNGITSSVNLGFGISHAAEFIKCTALPPKPSRNTVSTRIVVKGRIPEEEVRQMITNRWLASRSDYGEYKYPEFRQYIVSWMGCMFWKNDVHFDLSNHFKSHYCTNLNLDQYTENLKEELLNKPYKSNTSPWEIYAVYSCSCEMERNSKISSDKCSFCGRVDMTVFVIRVHHCLADGFAIIYAILEGLFDCPLIESLTKQKSFAHSMLKSQDKNGLLNNVVFYAKSLFQFCVDMGFVVLFVLFRISHPTSLRVSKNLKRSITTKSVQLPLQQVKQIKNHFEVSFSSVLLSSVSAVLEKHITKGADGERNRNMLIDFPVPLPKHPLRKLTNHVTFLAYNAPTQHDLDCRQRLLECNKVVRQVNKSLVPRMIFPWILNLMSCYIRPIAEFGLYNRTFISTVSNLPIPSSEQLLVNQKHSICSIDYAIGLGDGIQGSLFYTLAYNNYFQFMITADEAVLNRKDIESLVDDIVQELNRLYQLTLCK